MTELKKAESRQDFQTIEALAREIMPEVYNGIVPQFHVTFFLDTFQTVAGHRATNSQRKLSLLPALPQWRSWRVFGYSGRSRQD